MKSYHVSTKIKLGLIVFATLIAIASLAYTNHLVNRLKDREQSVIRLWASALEQLPKAQQQSMNPHQFDLAELEVFLRGVAQSRRVLPGSPDTSRIGRYIDAVIWAQGMPPASELSFIMDDILVPNAFDIPAVLTDARTEEPQTWRNIDVPSSLRDLVPADSAAAMNKLRARIEEMDRMYPPIPIEITFADARLQQQVHYGESQLVGELRRYPYVQFAFVGLFILVGYLGFSYVRRSEQSNLWVGMAKEAAHQLGTPISSLMGWIEILRSDGLDARRKKEAVDEVEKDVDRLGRVANRFSDIGSMPKLEPQELAPVVETTVEYIRRRLPQHGKAVELETRVEPGVVAPLNTELFEWVIENLLKNALDAIESDAGMITIAVASDDGKVRVDVTDSGRGIDRREWKVIFRPGFSTKKRGWGLGLSLAKRIVEDYHGGTLKLLQSRPGHGSTFRIEMPSARAPVNKKALTP